MTSVVRRVWVSAGPVVTVGVPFLAVWWATVSVGDLDGLTRVVLVGVLLGLGAALIACVRAAVAPDPRGVADRLGSSDEEFCLVLRPSGAADRNSGTGAIGRSWTDPDTTLEQVVALAARTALDQRTYTVVDQADGLTPPGPTYLRVPDPEWRTVARRLIPRAHSIVLVLPPHPDATVFAWEIEQIVRSGVQHRVIIVLPPLEQDVMGHWAALPQAAVLLTALRGPGAVDDVDHFEVYEYELRLEIGTVVLKCAPDGRVHAWATNRSPQSARREIVAASYVPALAQAITDIEQELRGLDFAVRYPRSRGR